MSGLLLGTNTATVVRRIAENNWVIAAQAHQDDTGGSGNNYCYCLVGRPGQPNDVWAWFGGYNPGMAGFNEASYGYSLDGGESWTINTFTLTSSYAPVHGQQQNNTLVDSQGFARDELGRVYTTGIVRMGGPGTDNFDVPMRLDNYTGVQPLWLGLNYYSIVVKPRPSWAGDSYVWWIYEPQVSLSGLFRANYDGNILYVFPLTITSSSSHANMSGKVGSNRLYIYWPNFKSNLTQTVPSVIHSIDISDPDNPTIVTSGFGSEKCISVSVVNHNVAYAHTIEYIFPPTNGSIWKTIDGGANWTKLIGPASNLTSIQRRQNFQDIMYSTVAAVSQDEVWVAGTYPFVYHTIDGGTLWDIEQYNGPALPATTDQGSGATGIKSWASIYIPPAVVARRRLAQATLIGAT